MHNETMLYPDDGAPATKGDLRRLRDEFAGTMATMASKVDLTRFATKDDLSNGLAKLEVRVDAKLDFWAQRIEASNERFRSEMLGHAERFATRTQRVETDETILIHRVDDLEKRVTSLESPPKRPS